MLKRMSGFTLTELLITLLINAFIFLALITLFLTNLNHYHKTMLTNQLNQQLQSTLLLMTNDIRRSGFWANASNDIGLDQNTNPFMAGSTDVSVNASNNCILFTYDHDANGILPSISSSIDDERYGYRLNGNALQTRPPGAAFSCGASGSAWENMTDVNNIQITSLSFVLTTTTITTGPNSRGIALRSVDISIAGRLSIDNSITSSLTQHVRIQNDKFIP